MRSWFCLALVCAVLIAPAAGCRIFKKDGVSKGTRDTSFSGLRKRGKKKKDTSGESLDPLGARNADRLLLDDLSPSQWKTTMKASSAEQDLNVAREEMANGSEAYRRAADILEANPNGDAHLEQFTEAANHFRIAASSAVGSKLEEEARFREGEAYFFADRYVQSNRAFEKLIADYSGTRYLDQAEQRRFAIAQYWLELSETEMPIKFGDSKRPRTGLAAEARRVLHRIRVDDPTGKLADDATMALANAFMRKHDYYQAADTFEDLRNNYPSSKHQFAAHMLELEARLKGYQGSSYDDTPLVKADELLKQIVRRFPDQAQEHLTSLEQQAGNVRNMLAARDYEMGEYFEGRGENRAAKLYYEQVAEKYQDTSYAANVQQQITEVASKPPVPGQHAKWLVDLFPSSEPAKPVIASGDNESMFR